MQLKTLDDVLQAELKDLYSAERQLVDAPMPWKVATAPSARL